MNGTLAHLTASSSIFSLRNLVRTSLRKQQMSQTPLLPFNASGFDSRARQRALLERITDPRVKFYYSPVPKYASPHIVFALATDNPHRALITTTTDKVDMISFATRRELYARTSTYWLASLPASTPSRDMGWWANRAALDDVFGSIATDAHASVLGGATAAVVDKAQLKLYKLDGGWQVWSVNSNQVTWHAVKALAYGEYDGGKPKFWKRRCGGVSKDIPLRRPERLVRRMAMLANQANVAADARRGSHISARDEEEDREHGGLSPGVKGDKRRESRVELVEVDDAGGLLSP